MCVGFWKLPHTRAEDLDLQHLKSTFGYLLSHFQGLCRGLLVTYLSFLLQILNLFYWHEKDYEKDRYRDIRFINQELLLPHS